MAQSLLPICDRLQIHQATRPRSTQEAKPRTPAIPPRAAQRKPQSLRQRLSSSVMKPTGIRHSPIKVPPQATALSGRAVSSPTRQQRKMRRHLKRMSRILEGAIDRLFIVVGRGSPGPLPQALTPSSTIYKIHHGFPSSTQFDSEVPAIAILALHPTNGFQQPAASKFVSEADLPHPARP